MSPRLSQAATGPSHARCDLRCWMNRHPNGRRTFWKRCAMAWPVLALALQGCAGTLYMPAAVPLPRLPTSSERDSVKQVALVIGEDLPSFLDLHVPSTSEAMARGSSEAMGGWLNETFDENECVSLGCLPFVAVIGGVVGAAQARGSGEVKAFRAYMASVLSETAPKITELVRSGVVERTSVESAAILPALDMDALAAGGFDAVLEVRVGLAVSGSRDINPRTSFQMSVESRLLNVPAGAPLHVGRYVCDTDTRRFNEWAAAGLTPLRSRMDDARSSLAEKIVDEVFLVQPITLEVPESGSWDPYRASVTSMAALKFEEADAPPPMLFGLQALNPPTTGPWFRRIGLAWTTEASARPTFRWEPFPPVGTVDSLEAALGGEITDVSYEFRLAEEETGLPGPLLLHLTGLVTNEYELERLLRSGSGYFWTVRARYEVNGASRVTEWGCTHPLGRLIADAPNIYSYRFKVRDE